MDNNKSFSFSLEVILFSDSYFDDFMSNIENIVLMDTAKFKHIMVKAQHHVLQDLHKRILDLVKDKFDLHDFEVRDARDNTTLMVKDLWFSSIGFVEGKLNSHMDEIYKSIRIPASKFHEQILLDDDSTNKNDFNLIARSLELMRNEFEEMKKEINDLKADKEKTRIEINYLKKHNEELCKKLNDITAFPPKTPLSGYNSSKKFQFPNFSEIVSSQLAGEEMETETIRNKRSREQLQSPQPEAKKPLISTSKPVTKPNDEKRKVTKTIGKKDDDGFLVVQRKRFFPVYMGRVSKEMSNDDVRTYVQAKNIGAYDIEQLNTEKHDRFKSFKFKIPYENKDSIFDSNLWPKGLLLRKFLSTGNRHLNEGVRLVNLPADDLNTAIIE